MFFVLSTVMLGHPFPWAHEPCMELRDWPDDGTLYPYCTVCRCWATKEHVETAKHRRKVFHAQDEDGHQNVEHFATTTSAPSSSTSSDLRPLLRNMVFAMFHILKRQNILTGATARLILETSTLSLEDLRQSNEAFEHGPLLDCLLL